MSKEDILEAIANMSVMEVVELISAMEEKFGVTAAAAVAVAAPAAGGDAGAAEPGGHLVDPALYQDHPRSLWRPRQHAADIRVHQQGGHSPRRSRNR